MSDQKPSVEKKKHRYYLLVDYTQFIFKLFRSRQQLQLLLLEEGFFPTYVRFFFVVASSVSSVYLPICFDRIFITVRFISIAVIVVCSRVYGWIYGPRFEYQPLQRNKQNKNPSKRSRFGQFYNENYEYEKMICSGAVHLNNMRDLQIAFNL